MQKSGISLSTRFVLMELLYFGAFGCYSPYIVAFLTAQGLSASKIGLIVMLNSLVTIIQPVWGMICDKMQSVRKVLLFILMILAVTVPVVTWIPEALYVIWVPFAIHLFFSATTALCDTWLVQGLKHIPNKAYGNFRLWGSVGYLVATSVMGYLADILSIRVVFYFFTVLCVLLIFLCYSIPFEGVDNTSKAPKISLKNFPVKALLKNYNYSAFVLCAMLLYIAVAFKNNFFVQRFYLAGGSNTLYGLTQAVAALSEVPLFYYSSKIMNRWGTVKVLRLSMIVQALQVGFLSLPVPIWAIFLAQATHGLGFALFLAASVAFIDSVTPGEIKASGMTLALAAYNGLAGMIGSSVSGVLIDRIGIMQVFFYGFLVAAGATILFLVLIPNSRIKQLGLSAPTASENSPT